jgi:predicted Fe-Mo cluster-binding NifX family protein
MKIAISARTEDLSAPIDMRFGRANIFICYDTNTKETSFHNNTQNLNAAQGAGIQAAQTVANLGVDAVITGHCGPKAFRVLQTAQVAVFYVKTGIPATEAIQLLADGKLELAKGADVESHWV